MPNVPYPHEVNWQLVTRNGSLTPICYLSLSLTVVDKVLLFFSWDSLTVYDGGSSTSPMMGKYCDSSIPPSHVSSRNVILIHFQSDVSETYTGFKMEYNPIGKQTTSIQNNTDYHGDRCRILGILIIFRYFYSL